MSQEAHQYGPLTLAEALDSQMDLEALACCWGADPQPSERLISLAKLYEQQCRALAEAEMLMGLAARSGSGERHSAPTLTRAL